jgi:1,3-beta-galactosyl-N-acetylhexosamine phosphorylase
MDNHGRMTLPADADAEAASLELLDILGADAVRNSDGTEVPASLLDKGLKVYSKRFVNRGDLDWAAAHPEELQEIYLLSRRATARGETVRVDLLAGYFTEQVQVDTAHDPKTWWEVRDRTAGTVVPPSSWDYVPDAEPAVPGQGAGHVVVRDAVAFHEYTVAFLAWDIWEPVHMYNHLTNGWGDTPHQPPYDVVHAATRRHAAESLRTWLDGHPQTTVVRFTTFFYQFTLIFNDQAKEKYVDWFGYSATVSPEALDGFAEEFGYRLTPEDFVDQGYYTSYFRTPTARWTDWMGFVRRFVAREAKKLVAMVHDSGREAMMFLGDQWIGTEPYGPDFASIGLDAVVGSVGNGATARMIADIPHVAYTEGRLLPYFFPDVFHEGGDPAGEALDSWIQARRAMVQNPVDRIGYGGYPALAVQFPDFITVAKDVAAQFRELHERRAGTQPRRLPRKVAIVNAWGVLRTWQTHMVAHALPSVQNDPYTGVIEALAGLPVDVVWMSFADLAANGIPDDVGVLVNAGTAGTAFSGGDVWSDPALSSAIRAWVDGGGALIGVGEPSALVAGGRAFQLADVLGVDQEVGYSLSTDKYRTLAAGHFVTADLSPVMEVGQGARNVYATEGATGATVLRESEGQVQLAVHGYGKGRAAYVAGLPYSRENARLLHRLLLWGMGLDGDTVPFLADNPAVEVTEFPEAGWIAVVNNSRVGQTANFTDTRGRVSSVGLAPADIAWIPTSESHADVD